MNYVKKKIFIVKETHINLYMYDILESQHDLTFATY